MGFVRVLVAAALVLVSASASAWNNRGHMMVAAVAWDQLEETTQERAIDLLKRNPNYDDWIKGVPKADQDKTAFMKAATWPDFIRGLAKKPSAAGPDDYVDDGSDPDNAPNANVNIGYEDRMLHRYWHFVDLPFSRDGTPLKQPKKPNALTQIIKFRDTIGSKTANDDVKSYDLVWLLHLVGDVHQPLHATARFSAQSPDGDRGGNDVLLCEDPCRKNLHSFWDAAAGTGTSIKAIIKAADELEEADAAEVDISDPDKWVEESFVIAKASVYKQPIGAGNGPFKATPAYNKSARAIANDRIALGGARLAKLLNDFLR
jgi:S1/P1 Nuclease